MPQRPPLSPPRVILAVDRPGWAFHNIASKVASYLGHEIQFSVGIDTELRNESCDILVAFRWDQIARLKANNKIGKVVLALYDFVTWTKTPSDLFAFTQTYKIADYIAVGNQELAEWIANRGLKGKPTYIVEDGVDCSTFQLSQLPKMFTAGWCGNASHGRWGIKGLEIIKEACETAKVPLVISDTSSNTVIPHDQMGSWYAGISCYICASTYEGTPNPPMEAMACGRPVITTKCGIMPRVVSHGVNGLFVDRDAESIAAALRELAEMDIAKMGALARIAAEAHDWQHKLPSWKSLLYAAVGGV